MKTYLIVSQILYLASLPFWFLAWGMSFMVFDGGIGLSNSLFFLTVTAYPLAVIGCSIAAWMLRRRRKRTAVSVGLIPALWLAGYAVLMLFV